METWYPILLIIAFTGCFIMHESYRIKDPVRFSRQWHFYKGGVQLAFFLLAAVINWRIALVGVVAYWILHDLILNVIAFNHGPFYVGYTSAIDKFFRRFGNPALTMALAKAMLLVITIFLAILIK